LQCIGGWKGQSCWIKVESGRFTTRNSAAAATTIQKRTWPLDARGAIRCCIAANKPGAALLELPL
jgi:hypothetical protein